MFTVQFSIILEGPSHRDDTILMSSGSTGNEEKVVSPTLLLGTQTKFHRLAVFGRRRIQVLDNAVRKYIDEHIADV
uniref:AMP-binding domain-containing protein n=1 Tax=Steinernema glaseri TaxID=37863 RepID=A0A1I7XXN8_9BILA